MTHANVRGELVAHQRHVTAAGAASRKDAAAREFHPPALQAVIEPPQCSQCVESLQVAEVIRFRAFDRVFRAALQIVHAERDDIELLGQHGGACRANTVGATPVVQRQHQTGAFADIRQFASGKMHEHSDATRPRTQRPLLSRNLDGSVLFRQSWPILGICFRREKHHQENNEQSAGHAVLIPCCRSFKTSTKR